MTALSKQELEIVQAFSSVTVPERVIRDSNIKDLIHGMTAEQETVLADAKRLERLRQEKKDGNFLGNWWNDRDDKVQDAQLDLNKSISRLTQKSSQLLIVNTAISKVLNNQQYILLEQQNVLQHQTNTLEEQNNKIFAQQKLLEQQQHNINQANQGLMEAKGLTQEQAQQLVGCVKLVKEAENRIGVANQTLKSNVEKYMNDSVEQCVGRLSSGFAEQEQRHVTFEQQITDTFSAQSQQIHTKLGHITAQSEKLKSAIEEQLVSTVNAVGHQFETLEQKLTMEFSTQSQHTRAELASFSSEAIKFEGNIRQQLQENTHLVLDKLAAQDAAAQQMQGNTTAKINKIQQELVPALEQNVLTLQEIVKNIERRQESAQINQNQALKEIEAQLTSLRAEQHKSVSSNRLIIATVTCLAVASLSWQVAQHFALV